MMATLTIWITFMKVHFVNVQCSADMMQIEITPPRGTTKVYLEHLKVYPDPLCAPVSVGGRLKFNLDLNDFFKCMVTRVLDKETGLEVFYHRLIIERSGHKKQAILVKCDKSEINNQESRSTSHDYDIVGNSTIVKRSAQAPDTFQEPDYDIEITSEITGRAPIPELIVGVKQEGILIDDELTVKPGTPLSMEINLDSNSKDIYGLMVSNMEVTDTQQQEEVLILNGCTVDPYLFENFLTEDGDLLRAKFKAFKFPESNFVLFRGVVNVCLDKCNGVDCANGQLGFGKKRRKRDVANKSLKNKIYEVSMSTVVRVGSDEVTEKKFQKIQEVGEKEKAIVLEEAIVSKIHHPEELAIALLSEKFGSYKYVDFQTGKEGSTTTGRREKRNSGHISAVSTLTLIAGLLVHLFNL